MCIEHIVPTIYNIYLYVVVQSLSCVQLCNPMDCSTSGFLTSPASGVCSNACPMSQTCHTTISSSVIPFSWLLSVPASESCPMSRVFAWGGQNIGASASAFLSMNIQGWSPLGWTGWISLQSKGLSRVFSNTTVQNINSFVLSLLYGPTLTSICDQWKNNEREMKIKVSQSCPTLCNPMAYTVCGDLQARILEWLAFPFSRGSSQSRDRTQVSCIAGGFYTSWATREAHGFDYMDFVGNAMSLVFNTLSRVVIAFLLRSKFVLISWLKSASTVILEPKKLKSFTVSIVYQSIYHSVMGPDAMILVFLIYLS